MPSDYINLSLEVNLERNCKGVKKKKKKTLKGRTKKFKKMG